MWSFRGHRRNKQPIVSCTILVLVIADGTYTKVGLTLWIMASAQLIVPGNAPESPHHTSRQIMPNVSNFVSEEQCCLQASTLI